jgi:hypothetical protein
VELDPVCDDGLERVVGDELQGMESEKISMRWGGWGGEREGGRGWFVVREREGMTGPRGEGGRWQREKGRDSI